MPQTTSVYSTAGTGITEFTSTELTAIETDLKTYTSAYSSISYTDRWSSEDTQGLTEIEYYNLKNKMLKSVYQNGGFYVGKYETGIQNSYRSYDMTEDDYYLIERPITETPVIKANAYPYNWVRCSQAQTLASSMESGEYTTSLMFGVQWDLVMKYLETKGVSQSLLNNDSTTWGNYANSEYSITNTSAKYATIDVDAQIINEYLTAPYSKSSGEVSLLTTGASELFGKMGIYDLAGNMYEWTLEKTSYSSYPCTLRGGYCYPYGDGSPAGFRGVEDATDSEESRRGQACTLLT